MTTTPIAPCCAHESATTADLPVQLGLPSRGPHGSRSTMTCTYRCGNACDQPIPNQTGHTEFADVAARALSRRAALGAGTLSAVAVASFATVAPAAAHRDSGKGPKPGKGPGDKPGRHRREGAGTWRFDSVQPNRRDEVAVPDGFTAELLVAWGDAVLPRAPRFEVRRQTAAAARTQFGYNNDYVGVLPHPRHRNRALLVVNHEYTDEPLMFPADTHSTQQILEVAIANHGMSVMEIERGGRNGQWEVVPPRSTKFNRRLHDQTPFEIVGPAAGNRRLRTAADPSGRHALGTFNNCAGGLTPWGTVLSGEENFNQYFDASGDLDARYAASYARLGITGRGRGWSAVDERFDLTKHPHEPYRFGWVVEVDPSDPRSTPRKHTMLGRFKHEGANMTISRSGHAVAYMGDDERGDYIYRFVSRDKFDPRPGIRAKRHNMTLLTAGTLYVARFDARATARRGGGQHDGTGQWIPLTSDRRSYVSGMSVADVLLDTRLAADTVAPTRMDRPEDVEVNPVNGKVYAALTNNSNRGSAGLPVDAANPVGSSLVRASIDAPLTRASGNRNGYVLEMTPWRDDHTADRFTWDLILVCGDPSAPETWFAGFPKQLVSPISCPDNVAFDSEGNLWISTDGNALGSNDGLFRMPVEGPSRGHLQQFLTVPVGAETCGPFVTEDQQSVLIAIQHPGEVDGASFETPVSTWPHTNAHPRPGVVVVRRT